MVTVVCRAEEYEIPEVGPADMDRAKNDRDLFQVGLLATKNNSDLYQVGLLATKSQERGTEIEV